MCVRARNMKYIFVTMMEFSIVFVTLRRDIIINEENIIVKVLIIYIGRK